MDIFEVTGFKTGLDHAGVSFLDPIDAFEELNNGYIYRQELRSRLGFSQFGNRLDDGKRVMGIFTDYIPTNTLSDLLVLSTEHLYVYNEGTNTFDVKANSGADFSISDNAAYISGNGYPDKDGNRRFVFTGSDMPAEGVYFYDGTSVKRYTNIIDNPDFEFKIDGVAALLNRADMVIAFNERIMFFAPVINSIYYPQRILYSGIRNSAGRGDKFNTVVGSGMLNFPTNEHMFGASVFGNSIIVRFDKSNWILTPTGNAQIPFDYRKIPGVVGTNASFSGVPYGYAVKSFGKAGLITTDGRETLRFDDKLPDFTTIEMDNTLFKLTYGGLDENLEQFMFAYRSNSTDMSDETQDKVLTFNYREGTFSIYDQRFSVFGQTTAGRNLVWDDIYELNDPSWARMDTTEESMNSIGINSDYLNTLAGDNDGFVYFLNQGSGDYAATITNITNALGAVITVSDSAFKKGDKVVVSNVLGMTEINGTELTVTDATATSVTVDIDTRYLNAYDSGGVLSKPIDFFVKLTPFNPYRNQGRKCYIQHIDILLEPNSIEVEAKLYENGNQSPFKTAKIIPSTDFDTDHVYESVSVNNESTFFSMSLSAKLVSTNFVGRSIRIYCEPGSMIGE